MKKHIYCQHSFETEVPFFDVDAMHKYIRPARFGQKIRVDMDIVEIESCLRIDYTIYDAETNEKLTRASTTQAAVSLSDGLMQFQTPDSWLEAVKRHPTFKAV